MRKATINNPKEEKVAASEYSVEVHHKGGNTVNFTVVQYTYDDVFECVKEKYEHDLDHIQKVVIEVLK